MHWARICSLDSNSLARFVSEAGVRRGTIGLRLGGNGRGKKQQSYGGWNQANHGVKIAEISVIGNGRPANGARPEHPSCR